MSERLDISITAEIYDRLVHGGAPEGGDLRIAYKAGAMQSGRGGVCIAFTALVDGKPVLVQAVTSVRLFMLAAQTIAFQEARSIGAVETMAPQGNG